MTKELPLLDVFYGELTAHRAVVYARLPRPADDRGLSLVGQVRGPRCLHAQTLAASSTLVDLGAGPTLLARAIVTEPVFWSSDLPAIYDVTVQLHRGTELIAAARREIGLRALGVRGGQLIMAGKPWVMRGTLDRSTTARLPREWHDAAAAFVTTEPDDERLAEASQWGAIAVVKLDGSADAIAARLKQIALQAALAIAVLPGDVKVESLLHAAPNVLLAQWIEPPDLVQPWAQLVFAEARERQWLAELATACQLPIVAVRPLESPLPLDQARAACDLLQRELAPLGQFAGYIV